MGWNDRKEQLVITVESSEKNFHIDELESFVNVKIESDCESAGVFDYRGVMNFSGGDSVLIFKGAMDSLEDAKAEAEFDMFRFFLNIAQQMANRVGLIVVSEPERR